MIIYKGYWRIEKKPKPIPDRTHDWDFWRDGYVDLDAPWQGTASSVDDAIRQIEEMVESSTDLVPKQPSEICNPSK